MKYTEVRRQVVLLVTEERSARDIADILDIDISRVSGVLSKLCNDGYVKRLRKHTITYEGTANHFYTYKLNTNLPFEQLLCTQCGEIKTLVDIDYNSKMCNNCRFIIVYGDVIEDAAQGYSHITVEFMQEQINDLKQMLYKITAENYKLIKIINNIYDTDETHS
jgi:predicted transcriptional regulator